MNHKSAMVAAKTHAEHSARYAQEAAREYNVLASRDKFTDSNHLPEVDEKARASAKAFNRKAREIAKRMESVSSPEERWEIANEMGGKSKGFIDRLPFSADELPLRKQAPPQMHGSGTLQTRVWSGEHGSNA